MPKVSRNVSHKMSNKVSQQASQNVSANVSQVPELSSPVRPSGHLSNGRAANHRKEWSQTRGESWDFEGAYHNFGNAPETTEAPHETGVNIDLSHTPNYTALLPMIITRATKRRAGHKQRRDAETDDRPLPPHTGITQAMLRDPPQFLNLQADIREPLGERVLFAGLSGEGRSDGLRALGDRGRLVFELFEPSIYRARCKSDPSGECFSIDSSWDSYPGLCAGRGGPTRRHYGLGNYFAQLPSYYVPQGPWDNTLVFESRFESANLRRAIQMYIIIEYILLVIYLLIVERSTSMICS
jgi:hypothetical protein